MKKSIFSKVGAAAVVLTLVTASLVGGTFAKYTTSVNATATATAAQWGVKFIDGAKEITEASTITLQPSNTAGKKTGTIVPGDSGMFEIEVDGTAAEVSFDYAISLAAGAGNSLNVTFYADDKHSTEISSAAPLTGTVEYKANATDIEKKATVPVYWVLNAGGSDAADTEMAGKTGNYEITLTATQKVPTTQPTN